jgi:hypothetical protein
MDLKIQIANMIALKKEELKIPMTPLSKVEEAFKELGFKGVELETNGWEVDFWQSFFHPEHGVYGVTGSLWSGNFKIYKDE